MATLYIDLENGNDNYGGTSFAVLQQGTNGRITSTTFSSVGASFPNDGSLIGQYLSIFNGTIYAVYNITAWVSATSLTIAALSGGTALANQASDRQFYIGGRWKSITTGATAVRTIPGDTIRVMGSPAPTNLGQTAAWTSGALQATKAITGATNATPISITCTAHGYSTGDTVVVASVAGNTNANGVWEITSTGVNTFTLNDSAGSAAYTSGGTARLRNNTRVMLTTAVTKNIALTGTWQPWTSATADVTVSGNQTDFKGHSTAQNISILGTFTTGLAAYWTLPSTTDFSGYQQVSFWIRRSAGTAGLNGAVELRLCSDTAGVNAVNIIPIPSLQDTGRSTPITVDLGTDLGSSIRSIAFYVNTDNAGQTFLLDNIIACKASSAPDSLTLTSLIGKNTTGETFWGIQSINGRRVMLDGDTNGTPISASVRGYYGTSETVTTWKRETIKQGPAGSSGTSLQAVQEGGTDGAPITLSAGWDRIDMSTQNIETWLDGQNGNGTLLSAGNLNFLTLLKFAFVRATRAIDNGAGVSNDWQVVTVASMANTIFSIALNLTGSGCKLTLGHGIACSGPPLKTDILDGYTTLVHGIFSCATEGIYNSATKPSALYGASNSTLVANNSGYGLYTASSGACTVKNIRTADNTAGGFQALTGGVLYCDNCLISESTETSVSSGAIYSQNHDRVAGNHKIFLTGALISSATDQRKTASGISWKIQPTSALRSSSWPVTLSLAKVAASANSLVTVKAWMYRDNAGLTMRLVCKGGQLAGVASDVVSTLTATGAWEEETITFTPTETGVLEIIAEAWGGTTFSGWVDDLSITQA
jgi:hypothetical protein